MRSQDYVSSRPSRRAGGRKPSKTGAGLPLGKLLGVGVLVLFVAIGVYRHYRSEAGGVSLAEQVKANKPKPAEAALPQEKWSYIERLENKQVDVTPPPAPAGVLPPESAPVVTPPVPALELPSAPVESAAAQQARAAQKAREDAEQALRAELQREAQRETKVQRDAQMQREQQVRQDAPRPAASNARQFLQCAVLRSPDAAESLKARIAFGAGLDASLQRVHTDNTTLYKVLVGPFSSKAALDAANRQLQASGISGCIVK
ncbi:MAG: SPOR domain-containing protein [Aeromonas sp.]